MEQKKRLTLNSEKRKAIADVFQNHFEQTSPIKVGLKLEIPTDSKPIESNFTQ